MKVLILMSISILVASCSAKPLMTMCMEGGSRGFALGEGYAINNSGNISKIKNSPAAEIVASGPDYAFECTADSFPVKFAKMCAGQNKEECQQTLLTTPRN